MLWKATWLNIVFYVKNEEINFDMHKNINKYKLTSELKIKLQKTEFWCKNEKQTHKKGLKRIKWKKGIVKPSFFVLLTLSTQFFFAYLWWSWKQVECWKWFQNRNNLEVPVSVRLAWRFNDLFFIKFNQRDWFYSVFFSILFVWNKHFL